MQFPSLYVQKNKAIWITSASLAALKSMKSSLQEPMNTNLTARMWQLSRWRLRKKIETLWKMSSYLRKIFFVRCWYCDLLNTLKEDITNKL